MDQNKPKRYPCLSCVGWINVGFGSYNMISQVNKQFIPGQLQPRHWGKINRARRHCQLCASPNSSLSLGVLFFQSRGAWAENATGVSAGSRMCWACYRLKAYQRTKLLLRKEIQYSVGTQMLHLVKSAIAFGLVEHAAGDLLQQVGPEVVLRSEVNVCVCLGVEAMQTANSCIGFCLSSIRFMVCYHVRGMGDTAHARCERLILALFAMNNPFMAQSFSLAGSKNVKCR